MTRLLPLAVVAAATGLFLAGCINVPSLGEAPTTPVAGAFVLDCSIAPGLSVWSDPCTALASFNPSPGKAEIDLAVNPKDPMNVVVASKDLDREASDCVWSIAQVTKDGGKTWKTVYIGGDRANRVAQLAPFACITDPIMVFDDNGVLYYALQAYRAGQGPETVPTLPVVGKPIVGSTFFLTRSLDGGETWSEPILMHAADGVTVFHDYPRMLVNPKTHSVCTIWNGVGSGGVSPWVVCSRNGGDTMDEPVTFFVEDSPRGTDFDSGFAAARDGTLYVTVDVYPNEDVVVGGGPREKDIRIFKSTNDAMSFEYVGKAFTYTATPRQLDEKYNKFRTPSFTEMAIDQSDGPFADRIYVFYPDYSAGNSDILSRYSTDGGVTWSEPVNIANDATNDQLFMRPVVGPDGTVHVLFATRAFDPANKLLDQMLASSKDGGLTWTNTRLTASGFDGDLGVHQNGPPFIGDYNGIRVGPDGAVWTAWGDTRSGVAEIAVARLVAGES